MSACESIRKTSRAMAYEKALCLNKSHFGKCRFLVLLIPDSMNPGYMIIIYTQSKLILIKKNLSWVDFEELFGDLFHIPQLCRSVEVLMWSNFYRGNCYWAELYGDKNAWNQIKNTGERQTNGRERSFLETKTVFHWQSLW